MGGVAKRLERSLAGAGKAAQANRRARSSFMAWLRTAEDAAWAEVA